MAYKNHNVWKYLLLVLLLAVFYCICTRLQCYTYTLMCNIHRRTPTCLKRVQSDVQFGIGTGAGARAPAAVSVVTLSFFSILSHPVKIVVLTVVVCSCAICVCVCVCQVRFVWPLFSVHVCFVCLRVCVCVYISVSGQFLLLSCSQSNVVRNGFHVHFICVGVLVFVCLTLRNNSFI